MTARRLSRQGHDHQIAPGVFGWLEAPDSTIAVADCVLVCGWVFASGTRVVSLRATGAGPDRPLSHGLRRDDVLQAYPEEPSARESGFFAYLELGDQPLKAAALQIWATLADGRSIELFTCDLLPATSQGSVIRRAIRQVIARPRLLLSSRAWIGALRLILARPGGAPSSARATAHSDALSRTSLAAFLASGARLSLSAPAAPVASVIVVVWNRADLTLGCLRALTAQSEVDAEVIVVDNGSTDDTREMLARLSGVLIVRNDTNLGFTLAANIGARRACGEFLLFLNNDAELIPGALAQLLETARRSSSIGAVGGKLVFPDGRLQEAGAIIWSDGSCDAYGRGDDPGAPEYNFERAVDYCSGALLLTRRALFEELAGFDERYRPAYYEDVDYGARLWTRGYSVVYQPRAVAIHREFGSAVSAGAAIGAQLERRSVFVSQHTAWLSRQCDRDGGRLAARSHPHRQPSAIWVDDAAPDARQGAGFPRAAAIIRALTDLGYAVTVYATDEMPASGGSSTIELIGGGPAGLPKFLRSRAAQAAVVVVSRPHNMQYVKAAVGLDLAALGCPCVYDAEAVYAVREVGRRRLAGEATTGEAARTLIDEELRLTRGSAAVLVVSDRERELFGAWRADTFVIGHAIEPQPTPAPFERRQSILFVGAFGVDSPNEDAAAFFCRDVLPLLRAAGCAAPVVIAGARIPDHVRSHGDAGVSWLSDVADLAPLYDAARLFIAPTRYAAGIPLKVIEAAAYGVPVVGTALVAEQLGWTSGSELLTFDEPEECVRSIARLFAEPDLWLRLREAALVRVSLDHSPGRLRASLQEALAAATVARPSRTARP